MATVKRYSLSESDIDSLIKDIERLECGLPEAAHNAVQRAIEHAEKTFDYFLSAATPNRHAAISTSTNIRKTKTKAVGTLTATGKTEDTGFNILMAVEFGAGIALNGGASNPSFAEMGMGVGTWEGQKHAFDPNGWSYPAGETDDKGKQIYRHTLGTPATMPMHRTILDTTERMSGIITEEIAKWLT